MTNIEQQHPPACNRTPNPTLRPGIGWPNKQPDINIQIISLSLLRLLKYHRRTAALSPKSEREESCEYGINS